MESKSHLKLYISLGVLFVVAVLLIYKDIFFPPAPAYNTKIGSHLPSVMLSTMDDKQVSLQDLLDRSGKKKAIIGFWATWCGPCVNEIPEIEAALPRLSSEDTAVILINYDGGSPEKTVPEVKAWLVAHGLKLTTYFDFKESLLDKMGVSALPFAMGINSQKKISWMETGELDWKKKNSVPN